MDDEAYKKAKEKVENIKGFYIHFFIYILINAFLAILNLVTSPDHIWFYWPLLGWGIGLLAHFMSVFVFDGMFGKQWEDRKVKEYMDKYDQN